MATRSGDSKDEDEKKPKKNEKGELIQNVAALTQIIDFIRKYIGLFLLVGIVGSAAAVSSAIDTHSPSTVTVTTSSTIVSTTSFVGTVTDLPCQGQIQMNFTSVPDSGYQAGIWIGDMNGCTTATAYITETMHIPPQGQCVANCANIAVQSSSIETCSKTNNNMSKWWVDNYAPCYNYTTLPPSDCYPAGCSYVYDDNYTIIHISNFPETYIGIAGNNEDIVQVYLN